MGQDSSDSLTISRTRLNSTYLTSTQHQIVCLLSDWIEMEKKTFASGASSQRHLSKAGLWRPKVWRWVELVRSSQVPSLILSFHIWRGGSMKKYDLTLVLRWKHLRGHLTNIGHRQENSCSIDWSRALLRRHTCIVIIKFITIPPIIIINFIFLWHLIIYITLADTEEGSLNIPLAFPVLMRSWLCPPEGSIHTKVSSWYKIKTYSNSDHYSSNTTCIRWAQGSTQEKNTGLFGNFPQTWFCENFSMYFGRF